MNTNVIVRIVQITPELATAMLRLNDGNRHVAPSRVEHYARLISDGLWTISNDAICISPNGRLLNGQHRLHAVIRAGLAIEAPVMENVTEDAFKNMDQGRKRSVSDNTRLPRTLVADATFLFSVTKAGSNPSPAEVEEVAAWWRPAWDALAPYGFGDGKRKANSVAMRIGAGLRWATSSRRDREIVLKHAGQVVTSELEQAPKAVWALWRRLGEPGSSLGLTARLQRAFVVYYYLDPKKADLHPLIKNQDIALKELRQVVQNLPDLYSAGPSRDGHPYAPYELEKMQRPLSGVALVNYEQKKRRENPA